MLSKSIYTETCRDLKNIPINDLLPLERVEAIRAVYRARFEEIKKEHKRHTVGLEISRARSALMDALLQYLYEEVIKLFPQAVRELSLIALGGYGRGYLNPYSDVDLLFLTKAPSSKLPEEVSKAIEAILYPLWDLGFKVGHASRNISECLSESLKDNRTLTSLLEARHICGDRQRFEDLTRKFRAQVVKKRKKEYLKSRMEDLERRYSRYSHTVFLQEPNIKESPGGLRDYQNILWTANVTMDCLTLDDIVSRKLLSQKSARFLTDAVDFLHWIRNELHFRAGRASDILTLQLQGVIATPDIYPNRSILRRTEAFMKDYYLKARGIADRLLSVIEQLNLREKQKPGFLSLLPFTSRRTEKWDGFVIKHGHLYACSPDLFSEDPSRLMRAFQICQMRGIDLSPELRFLIKSSGNLVDDAFRHDASIAETFQSILERKGAVARILRLMHRVGFLGKWLPEFGSMDCLVQHEFFHRYTADEHTLRCIDQLDALFSEEDSNVRKTEKRDLLRKIFLNIDDPYALYLSLILHDSGRAENVREHIDGSAMLASNVCTRLGIVGSRRRMIMFLVDHHLTFWRYATTRNIDDIDVIEEFARAIKTQGNLEALYLFTYADSMGTNEESWSSWKDSLMWQLYRNTSRYLTEGDASSFEKYIDEETRKVKEKALITMGAEGKEADLINYHFSMLPKRYFRFRKMSSVVAHLETMERFRKEREASSGMLSSILWRDYPDKGYTEFVVTAMNQPFFIEKLCCALAYQQINILSAEIFTRKDGQILDILRICTVRHEPVTEPRTRKKVEEVFQEILPLADYHPEKYLQKRRNFLTKPQEGLPFPVRAWVRNDGSPHFSLIEIQARDRIGLLHDVFRCIGEFGLQTINARIATEKGAALDTIYITDSEGKKVENDQLLRELENKLNTLIA